MKKQYIMTWVLTAMMSFSALYGVDGSIVGGNMESMEERHASNAKNAIQALQQKLQNLIETRNDKTGTLIKIRDTVALANQKIQRFDKLVHLHARSKQACYEMRIKNEKEGVADLPLSKQEVANCFKSVRESEARITSYRTEAKRLLNDIKVLKKTAIAVNNSLPALDAQIEEIRMELDYVNLNVDISVLGGE